MVPDTYIVPECHPIGTGYKLIGFNIFDKQTQKLLGVLTIAEYKKCVDIMKQHSLDVQLD